MNKCFAVICSKEYINYYRILYNSLVPYGYKQILYYIGDVQESFDEKIDISTWFDKAQYPDTLTKICSLRARVVLDAFNRGYEQVVFLGAKVEFYDDPQHVFNLLKNYNAVVTPHILEPLTEDGKFPSNASVSFTGHISTDVVGFKNVPEIVAFLKWQDEIMLTKCKTTQHTYLDQSWLNFLPFFVDNIHILRHLGWNVAYWNMFQRGMHKNIKWSMKDKTSLTCFQFSGIIKDNEEALSTHQNRYKVDGELLEFLKKYTSKL